MNLMRSLDGLEQQFKMMQQAKQPAPPENKAIIDSAKP
jgi:hypothetical protein